MTRQAFPRSAAAPAKAAAFLILALASCLAARAADAVARHKTENLTSYHFHLGGGSGEKAVTPEAAARFVGEVVTPRFPTGTTVQRGDGQWLNPDTGEITREKSYVFAVELYPTPENLAKIEEIGEEYVRRHLDAGASCFVKVYPGVTTELFYPGK